MAETTTTPKKSLFASAKKQEDKSKAKTDKLEVIIKEEESPGISQHLKRLDELRTQIEEMTAEAKMIEGIVKPLGRRVFLELYQKHSIRPESFIIKGEQGGSFMVLLTDKYPKIDEARYNELKSKYGAEMVEMNTTYLFDTALVKKYEEVLSEIILNCPQISEEDKGNLFVAKEEYGIKKGAIDRLAQFKEKLPEVLNAIEPVMQLKNTGNKMESK